MIEEQYLWSLQKLCEDKIIKSIKSIKELKRRDEIYRRHLNHSPNFET